MFPRIRSILNSVLHRSRFRRELDEEMAFHLERLTEDLIESGLEPEQARREARLRFGSREGVQSMSREVRGLAVLDEAARNLRFALRGMRRNPLFSATFVLTLGLCLGAGTAVYSVVDAVLWRPLPYPDPDRLALVVAYDPAVGKHPDYIAVDGAVWERIHNRAESFQRAVFSDWRAGVNLSTESAAAYVQQQRVSANFFATLGIAPLIGREFEESEDVPGGPAVAILSHALWARTFNEDPAIIGRTIRLKGKAHTVVGVMPEGFRSSIPADVWTPLRPSRSGEGGGANYAVLVRLPTGMSWEEADARIGAIEPERSSREDSQDRRFGLVSLDQALSANMRQPLLLLLGAILLMLLVGCANLASLQIARALARRPEIATRQALGGGIGAIVRQMMVENVMLGLLGGLAGLAIAYVAMGGLGALVRSHFDVWQPILLDARVLAAAFLLTLLATLLFGLAPVLQVRKFDLRAILVGGARGLVGGGGHHLRKALLVGEVALVAALLFGAGLLLRSYEHLGSLDPGFEPEGVLTVQLSLDDARYAGAEEVNRFFDETLDGIRRLPGVSSAAVALTVPYERPLNLPYKIVGAEDAATEYPVTNAVYVTPGFFRTLGIPLLRGRVIEEADRADAPPVVVANQAFVAVNLTGREPIGSRVTFGGGDGLEIVGVVGDVQQSNAGWGPSRPVWESPTLYVPAAQAGDGFLRLIHVWFSPSWLVRAGGRSPELATRVTAAIHDVDPDMPVARIATLSDVMGEALARPRFEGAFLAVVAGFALLLALVGLYGIVANEVVERAREMGLRMALGATPRSAVWATGLRGLRLTLLGLLVGALIATVGARWLAHIIWGVSPYDPLTIALVVVCLTALAGAASFVPAARIARLDPVRILREE
jgi:predicted permease